MGLNLQMVIDDLQTKALIKQSFSDGKADSLTDSVIFKSMELNDTDNSVTITMFINRLFEPQALELFTGYISGLTGGRKVKYSPAFAVEITAAQAVKTMWKAFLDKFDAERTWLEYAVPEIGETGLVLQCSNDLAISRLSGVKTIMLIRKKINEFTGLHAEVLIEKNDNVENEKLPIPVVKSVEITISRNTQSKVLKDEEIKGEVTPIGNIVNPGKYIVEGRIFIINEKDYYKDMKGRDGVDSAIVLFYVTDENETMKMSCFIEKSDGLFDEIKNLTYGKLSLTADYFPGEAEITGRVNKIQVTSPPEVTDNAEVKRVELHAHTQMSAMDALTNVEEYIKQAVKWGHTALAITDHGVVHAYPHAYNFINDKKRPQAIKLIMGMEGYLVERNIKMNREDKEEEKDTQKPMHIIILVKNKIGLRNLYKIVSMSHLNYFYKKPRIPREILKEHRTGLVLGSACFMGELYQALLEKKSNEEIKSIAQFYDYLEIQPDENNKFLIRIGKASTIEDLHEINRKICAIGEENNIPVVATGDIHFLKPADRIYRDVLMSAQGYDEIGETTTADLSFKTTEAMLEEFAYLGKEKALEVVVTNTRLISDMIEANIRPVPETLHTPSLENSDEEIRKTSWDKAAEIYGINLPDIVRERVDRELKAIIGNNYSVLYLIAKKMVEKSNQDGYIVGSRGSVGSSLVAYLCGISEVNPLESHYICGGCQFSEFFDLDIVGIDMKDKDCPVCGNKLKKDGYNIPFETFMGFKGDKVPDIDLNFAGEYQETIHKYLVDLFGVEKVYRAGTILTVMDNAIKKDFLSKYEEKTKKRLREANKIRLAKGCAGVKRSTSQHAGGLMLVPKDMDIYDFTPIQNPPNDFKTITTHFEYDYIHDALVKIDALGHDMPTSIKNICEGLHISVDDIPLDDKEALKIFSGVTVLGVDPKNYNPAIGSLGIPEYGTKNTRGMLAVTKPKTFSDLIYISGLSHGTNVWHGNAEELIKNKVATLKEVISVRDDIMNFLIAKEISKVTAFAITESVRKGNGLIKEWEDVMRRHKVPEWYITSCKKIKYMFPKAHAV
ncbi:MAG: PolC-type DNA polymerase III, partial [bacterium]